MKKLTQKQADVLAYIKQHIKQEGMAPTAKEIGDWLDIYPNGAWLHVKALITKGAITQTQGKMRSLVPVKGYRVKVKS